MTSLSLLQPTNFLILFSPLTCWGRRMRARLGGHLTAGQGQRTTSILVIYTSWPFSVWPFHHQPSKHPPVPQSHQLVQAIPGVPVVSGASPAFVSICKSSQESPCFERNSQVLLWLNQTCNKMHQGMTESSIIISMSISEAEFAGHCLNGYKQTQCNQGKMDNYN